MSEIFPISVPEVVPPVSAVLRLQGVQPDVATSERINTLVREAYVEFRGLAEPQGILEEISTAEFGDVYAGEGKNDAETPLDEIYPQSERLALFAVTLGEPVSARIRELFEVRDFALAVMLDSVASEAADQTAAVMEQRYDTRLKEHLELSPESLALRYSPGYCGWNVSGQKALFGHLKPEAIGITLRESCLMEPLKSVSGVIVYGQRRVHEFVNDYPCCAGCTTQTCIGRL